MFGGIAARGAEAIVYATFDGTVVLLDLDGPRVTGQFAVYPSGPSRVHVSACAMAPDGAILLGDALHHRVRVFQPDGRQQLLLGALHNPGIPQQDMAGVLDEPCAVLPLGEEILVACGGLDEEHGVQVFGRGGEYRRSFPAPTGGWKRAQGLAEVEGAIWVAETEAGHLRIHAPDGTPRGRLPLHPELRRPFRVKADGYGGVFLLIAPESEDSEPYGVARIARDGTFDGWTVAAGEEPGQALAPFDVAVLPDGRFVVADLPFGRPPEVRLQLFSSDGRLIDTLLEDTADLNAVQRAWFESVLALPGRDPRTLYEQARVHHYHAGAAREHQEQARDLYGRAIEADPRFLLARLGLGTLLHRGLGDPKAAEAQYRAALEAGAAEGDMLARIAECRHDAGDLDGAIRLMQKAIESLRPPEGYHDLVEELGDYYLERDR
ncbi:MAG TPA: hypothetical protein VFY93_01460 [Planctomycetota bacterium]|nr:hypothetical protein [Planctomycetota bacterium]